MAFLVNEGSRQKMFGPYSMINADCISRDQMEKIEMTFKMALELDETWGTTHSENELTQYIKRRLNSSLGFRGTVSRLKVVKHRNRTKPSRELRSQHSSQHQEEPTTAPASI